MGSDQSTFGLYKRARPLELACIIWSQGSRLSESPEKSKEPPSKHFTGLRSVWRALVIIYPHPGPSYMHCGWSQHFRNLNQAMLAQSSGIIYRYIKIM